MLGYIIITIVESYTEKYHEFVAVCIVTSVQHGNKSGSTELNTLKQQSFSWMHLRHYLRSACHTNKKLRLETQAYAFQPGQEPIGGSVSTCIQVHRSQANS